MEKAALQDVLEEQISSLQEQEFLLRQKRELLERTLMELQAMEGFLTTGKQQLEGQKKLSTPVEGINKTAIVSILREAGRPLRITAITQRAMQNGSIQSEKGQRGVYSIVQTILNRNKKKIFLKRGRGVWDLRERLSNKAKNNAEVPQNEEHVRRKEAIVTSSLPYTTITEGPYTGKSIGDAIEAVFEGNDNIPLTVQDIVRILRDGGWVSEAKNPRQSIASTLSRDPRFENALGEGYRLKREKNSTEAVH